MSFGSVIKMWQPAEQIACYRSSAFVHRDQFLKSSTSVNPRSLEESDNRTIRPPPPSTFDTIHPIDLKFGTYNKLHVYFQLSETCCLIGFHGNNSQINDVTGSRHLGFLNIQILFKFSLFYLRLTGKQHLAVEIHEIDRVHCEVVSI